MGRPLPGPALLYSGALLSEEALLAALAYVDLNPVRAGTARRIEACRDTSIAERLRENSAEALEANLAPLVSGLGDDVPARACPSITQRAYVEMVRGMAEATVAPVGGKSNRVAKWLAPLAVLGRRQRAYGSRERLVGWAPECLEVRGTESFGSSPCAECPIGVPNPGSASGPLCERLTVRMSQDQIELPSRVLRTAGRRASSHRACREKGSR